MVKTLHYSFGERKLPSDPSELEMPHVTFPLYRAMDYFVATPKGEELGRGRRGFDQIFVHGEALTGGYRGQSAASACVRFGGKEFDGTLRPCCSCFVPCLPSYRCLWFMILIT